MLQVLSGTPIISHTKRELPLCERYLAKTAVYRIPILSGIGLPNGPRAMAEVCERAQGNIVENQLIGAIDVHGVGVFEEGTYTVDDDNSLVSLDNLRAFVKGVFVENFADQQVIWNFDPDVGSDQYLFVGLVEEGDGGRDDYRSSRQFGEFVTRVSTDPVPGQAEIMLGKKPSGIGTTVDLNVGDNRKSFKTVETHVFDDSPHGGLWTQTEAIVSGIEVRLDTNIITTGTVLTSGVFPGLNSAPGFVEINDDLTAQGNLDVQGSYRTSSTAIFEGLTEFQGELSVESMLRVESGLDVLSITTVHDDWEFNNQRSQEGVSFRPIRGSTSVDPWGRLSSTGDGYKLYDPSAHGRALDDHIGKEVNPHNLKASGISPRSVGVLSILGDTLHGSLAVGSGIAVDGIDFSELQPLIDGSNADDLHKHLLLQEFEYQYLSPEYPSVVTSGVQPGWLEGSYDEDENRTQYSWYALDQRSEAKIVVRPYVPIGHVSLEDVTVYSRVSSGVGAGNVNLKLYDTAGVEVGEGHHMRNKVLLPVVISGIGGTFTEQSPYRIEIDMLSELGRGVHVSDIIMRWRT